jgi:hypothetical protein
MIRLYLYTYLCKKFRPRDENLYSILYSYLYRKANFIPINFKIL